MNKPAVTFNKSAELDQAEEKIADILADAIYSFITRKGIRKALLANKVEAKDDHRERVNEKFKTT